MLRHVTRTAVRIAGVLIVLLPALLPAATHATAIETLAIAGSRIASATPGAVTAIAATVTDADGNVYVAGASDANSVVVGKDTGGTDVALAGDSGLGFVVKYDAGGQVLWGRTYARNRTGQGPVGIALDGASPPNVYLGGVLSSTLGGFGNDGTIILTPVGIMDPFVAKLDGASGSIAWIEAFGVPSRQLTPSNIAVSSDGGSVYLVGLGAGNTGSEIVDFPRMGAFLARIVAGPSSRAFGTIVPFYTAGGGNVTLSSLVVTATGDVYAAGGLQSSDLGSPGTVSNTNSQTSLLAGYDAALSHPPKLLTRISSSNSSDKVEMITADAANLYLSGTFSSQDLVLDSAGGPVSLTAAGGDTSAFIARLGILDQVANPGRVHWATGVGNAGILVQNSYALAVDTAGRVVAGINGYMGSDLTTPPLARIADGFNIAALRLDADGNVAASAMIGAATTNLMGKSTGISAAGVFAMGMSIQSDLTVPPVANGTAYQTGALLRVGAGVTVTAVRAGTGSGTVSSDVGGIACGTACTSTGLLAGSTLRLTAAPDAGSSFTGWTGACHGNALTTSISPIADATCTATFAPSSGGGGMPISTPPPTPPSFVTSPPATNENAGTVGSGSGSVSFAANYADPAALTFTAAPAGGGSLPGWISFDPATVTFRYDVPLPDDLPIQPLADGRAARADARANWSNTIYPLLLRVAQVPIVLTATDRQTGVSYTSTIQMSFHAPRSPAAMSAISLSLDRIYGNRSSGRSALSHDGGQMIFETAATNLFPAAPSPHGDIVRYHGLSGTRDRLSQTAIPGGGVTNAAAGTSSSPAVSADGTFAAFASDAPSISATPSGGKRQVYRTALGYPRVGLNQAVTPAAEMVSATADGIAGNGRSDNPAVSQDGRYVAFDSDATNFAAGLDGTRRVWRKDVATGEILPVGAGSNPAISWDGRTIAFEAAGQIMVGDMATGAVRNLGPGMAARLSARGNLVTFAAAAKVVQVDLATGSRREIGTGDQPAMSADGRFVAYRGVGANGFTQIWLHDVERGVTALVTQTATGTGGNGDSLYPAVSGDGTQLAFASGARDLVNGTPTGTQAYVAANPLPLPGRTGYWYLAAADTGQGWVMERWGDQAYVGGLLYDAAGRAMWLSGYCRYAGLTCTGSLFQRTGGTPFGAAAGPGPVPGGSVGVSLATSEDGRATMLKLGDAPGQSLAMFPIGGAATTGFAGLPQAGWWMETGSAGGNGYFIAVDTQAQADGSVSQVAYVSALTFDAAGRPVWYSSQAALAADLGFSGMLMQYDRTAGVSAIGQLRIAFTGTDKARINLPNGRTANLSRFRF